MTAIKTAQAVAEKVAHYQEGEVAKLSTLLGRFADGDLTIHYQAAEGDKDTAEVKQAFSAIGVALNQSVQNLRELMGQIAESAEQFNEGSRVVADSSQMLASGAQDPKCQRGADECGYRRAHSQHQVRRGKRRRGRRIGQIDDRSRPEGRCRRRQVD